MDSCGIESKSERAEAFLDEINLINETNEIKFINVHKVNYSAT